MAIEFNDRRASAAAPAQKSYELKQAKTKIGQMINDRKIQKSAGEALGRGFTSAKPAEKPAAKPASQPQTKPNYTLGRKEVGFGSKGALPPRSGAPKFGK
jgi:hypothetical protein